MYSSASVGSIHIGGVNESHEILYPNSATCDEKILEELMDEYVSDEVKRFQLLNMLGIKVNEEFSFKKVRKQIEELYG